MNTPLQRTQATVAGGTTDGPVVTAVAGKRIRVLAFHLSGGTAAATTVAFNTKPAGAGTAISPVIPLATNGNDVAPFNEGGWFETSVGEGLAVTTGAGAAVGVIVTYVTL